MNLVKFDKVDLKTRYTLKLEHINENLKQPSLKVSLILNSLLSILNIIIPFITAPYLSRVLSPDGLGTYNYILSLVGYFNLVIAFGFNGYGVTTLSKKRELKNDASKTFSEIFYAKMLLLITVLAVYYICIFAGAFAEEKTFLLIVSLNIISTGIDVTFLFRGFEKFKQLSLITALLRILNLILIFVFIKSQNDLTKYFIIETSITFAQAIVILVLARKFLFFSNVTIKGIIEKYKVSFKYFLPEVAAVLYTALDVTMLGQFSTKAQVSYYYNSNRIISLINSIITSVTPVLLSRVSYLISKNKVDDARNILKRIFSLALIIQIPAILGILLVGNYFIPAYFGKDYVPAIPVLYVLSPLIFIIPTGSILLNGYFVPNGRRNICTVFAFIAAGINLICNLILIPNYGAIGAAIASVIAESIVCILNIIFSRKFFNLFSIFSDSIKMFAAGILMTIFIVFLNIYCKDRFSSYILLLIDIAVGSLIYFVSLNIFKDTTFLYLKNMVLKKFKKKKKDKV